MSLGTFLSLPGVSPRNGSQKKWRKWTPSRSTRASGSKGNFPALYIVRLPTSNHREIPFPHLPRWRRRYRKNHRRRLQTVLRLEPLTSRRVPRCVQSPAPLFFHPRLINMQPSAKWRQKSWQCASGCKSHPSSPTAHFLIELIFCTGITILMALVLLPLVALNPSSCRARLTVIGRWPPRVSLSLRCKLISDSFSAARY